jgi:hypothetical protein
MFLNCSSTSCIHKHFRKKSENFHVIKLVVLSFGRHVTSRSIRKMRSDWMPSNRTLKDIHTVAIIFTFYKNPNSIADIRLYFYNIHYYTEYSLLRRTMLQSGIYSAKFRRNILPSFSRSKRDPRKYSLLAACFLLRSIFVHEDGGSVLLRNISELHTVTFQKTVLYILSSVWVTIDGVWIDNSMYWQVIYSRLVTTFYRSLTHTD